MAGPILSFSDSDCSDNEVKFKKKTNSTTFRARGLKFKKKVGKNNDSTIGVDRGAPEGTGELEEMEDSGLNSAVKFKRNSVRFQLNKTIERPLQKSSDMKEVLNQYGAINCIQNDHKSQLDDAVEGFYLNPSSESEIENESVEDTVIKEEDQIDIDIRAIENQILKEEFITEDASSTKRTRAVLERDHEALQLDQSSHVAEDELLAISLGEKNNSEKQRQLLIQEALERAVDSDESDTTRGTETQTVDLILNDNVVVTYPKVPAFETSAKNLHTRIEKLHALRMSQQSKREQFSKELDAINAKQNLNDIIDFARLNIIA